MIDARLLRVEVFADASASDHDHRIPQVILRLTKSDAPYIELAEEQAVQFRVAGEWLSPEKLHRQSLEVVGFPDGGLVGVVPNRHRAEAFRLHLTYRRLSQRQETETWLVGRDWWGKAPKLCAWLCNRLSERRKWRHSLLEFELPKERWWSAPEYEPHEPPHNSAAPMSAPTRLYLQWWHHGRPATEQRC